MDAACAQVGDAKPKSEEEEEETDEEWEEERRQLLAKQEKEKGKWFVHSFTLQDTQRQAFQRAFEK